MSDKLESWHEFALWLSDELADWGMQTHSLSDIGLSVTIEHHPMYVRVQYDEDMHKVKISGVGSWSLKWDPHDDIIEDVVSYCKEYFVRDKRIRKDALGDFLSQESIKESLQLRDDSNE